MVGDEAARVALRVVRALLARTDGGEAPVREREGGWGGG